MDVRVVAPALLSLAELVTAASQTVYPEREAPRLSVEKTKEGSFEVILALDVAGIWDHIRDALGGDTGQALTQIKDLLFGGGAVTGLVGFIKWKRGRKETKREQLPDGRVTVIVEDGGRITVDARTLHIHDNPRARQGLYGVVEPLEQEGIDEVEVESESGSAQVDSTEVPFFAPVDDEEDLGTYEVEKWVEIDGVSFSDGRLRLREGANTYSAALEDSAFQRRINDGEKFAKGDGLRCQLEVTQWRSRRGIESRYTIIKVLEHSVPLRFDDM